MNRGELVVAVAERAGVTRATAERVLTAVFDVRPGVGVLTDALDRDERVVIAGFGSFRVVERAGRRVPDPSTGARRWIPAARVPRFRPSGPLRDRLA